ncbi:hypothetical protein CRYUN_Cryun40dG0034300 [Craigia yunnanensis]
MLPTYWINTRSLERRMDVRLANTLRLTVNERNFIKEALLSEIRREGRKPFDLVEIGPKEFTSVFYSLQNWRPIFEKFDRDRSGKMDANELREALLSLGFAVSSVVLDLLVSKFDKTGSKKRPLNMTTPSSAALQLKD